MHSAALMPPQPTIPNAAAAAEALPHTAAALLLLPLLGAAALHARQHTRLALMPLQP
jgi:hypothetical protein